MKPGDSDESLQTARHALVSGGLLTTALRSSDVRPDILRSWRRCVSASTPSEQIRTRRIERGNASGLLTRAAAPILDHLEGELADLGVAVLMTNRSGRIIARRVADFRQRDRLDDHYVLEGFDYSEPTVGTNGLGTALEDKQALWVHGAEHFNEALQVFACAGVPILSPRNGVVAGSLSLAATAAAANPMMMSLTKLAASQVEQALKELVWAREATLVSAFQRSKAHRGPSMLLTDDSVLADTALLPLMIPSTYVALWEAAQRHAWTDGTAELDVTVGDVALSVEARRIVDADGPAYLLEFPAQPFRRRRPGLAATVQRGKPALRVHAVPEVSDRVLAAAAAADVLAFNGPPGSGRLRTASQLASAEGRDLLVLNATTFDAASSQEWLARAVRGMAAGSRVVIRHAEQMPVSAIAAMESILSDSARQTKQRRGLLVATVDRTRAPQAVSDLLDRLAVTIDLPSLAEMRECVPGIAEEILESLSDGRVRWRLSSSSLQALLRWNWPGNVRELRSVLQAAAATARGAVIQVDDLPPRITEAHRSASLSGIERAERTAIVTALAKWRGNRSRAAEELGIGRTTLYRKMRELKITNDGNWLE
ncbi:sigma-54-dependent Fis family transcriptional regulator [Nonomuraea guangzhouensis]|uniref:sigma-54-dependent Fis family transcriptional regulator n=1 Tax=Nonomuraea guangzhouensis TaxID=1291555 RepID=UPI002484D226